jgi:hypothetical protein
MQDYREEGSLCSNNSDQGGKLFILQKLDIANPPSCKTKDVKLIINIINIIMIFINFSPSSTEKRREESDLA